LDAGHAAACPALARPTRVRDASGASFVEIPAALAAQLTVLDDALDGPAADLEVRLRALAAALAVAVPSLIAISVTTPVAGEEVTLHLAVPGGPQVAASLVLPLPAGTSLALYAATPGALADLAADLTRALGLPRGSAVLDGDLSAPVVPSGVAGLADLSVINRAIGVLIDRGHPASTARAELRRRAAGAGESLLAAAQRLVAGRPLPTRRER
jgi:hypothetical protein